LKLIVFLLGVLIFSTQVDFYNIDLVETSIVLEIEENSTEVEELISHEHTSDFVSTLCYSYLKNFKPYLLSFDQINPD
jgi:hypothetical protein